jgi:hypothetical protein
MTGNGVRFGPVEVVGGETTHFIPEDGGIVCPPGWHSICP